MLRSLPHRNILVALAVVALVVILAAAARGRLVDGDESDQCALPLAQRTGAWTCAGPVPRDHVVRPGR